MFVFSRVLIIEHDKMTGWSTNFPKGAHCRLHTELKVLRNEKKGGVKGVSFDRSRFKELSLLFFTYILRTLAL